MPLACCCLWGVLLLSPYDAHPSESLPAGNGAAPASPGALLGEVDELDDLLAEGRWDEAEELLRRRAQESPEPGPRLRLAGLLLQRCAATVGEEGLAAHLADGRLWEARAIFEEVARAAGPAGGAEGAPDPDALEAWLGAARSAEALADPEGSWSLLDEARSALPAAAAPLLVEEGLRIALDAGRLDTLESRLAEAGDRIDEDSRSLWRLRLASVRRDAAACAQLCMTLGGMEGHAWEIGWRLWASHQGDDSTLERLLHEFSRLVAAFPSVLEYRYYRGEVRVRAGDHSGAESDLRPCVQDPVLEIPARFALGRALLGQGLVDEAAAEFRAVVQARDASWRQGLNGLLDVAVRHGTAGRHQQALEVYREVLAEDPGDEFALLGVPLCHKGMEDVATAEAEYRRALQILPEHAQLRNDLALLVRGAGREEEARELFVDATASGSVDATENLGVIAWWDDRDPGRAAEWFARVLVVEPDRAKSRFYRELALSRLRREQRSQGEDGDGGGR